MWQDYALSAIFLTFCITLTPILFNKEKPPLISSLPTGILLLFSAGIYATLHLWFSTGTQAITGLEWLIFAYQKWRQPTLPPQPPRQI